MSRSVTNVILAGLAAQNEGEFKVVGKPFTEEPYGIGLALEDTEFRMWINDVLEKAEEDGRYEEAWNETAGTVLPLRVTSVTVIVPPAATQNCAAGMSIPTARSVPIVIGLDTTTLLASFVSLMVPSASALAIR